MSNLSTNIRASLLEKNACLVEYADVSDLAEFIYFVFDKKKEHSNITLWRILAVVLAGIFIVIRLTIAPVALPARAAYSMIPKTYADKLMITNALDKSVENQELVIVNPPIAFLMLQSPMIWECSRSGFYLFCHA